MKVRSLFVSLVLAGATFAGSTFIGVGPASASVARKEQVPCGTNFSNIGYIGSAWGARVYSSTRSINDPKAEIYAMICSKYGGADVYYFNRSLKSWVNLHPNVRDFALAKDSSGDVYPMFTSMTMNGVFCQDGNKLQYNYGRHSHGKTQVITSVLAEGDVMYVYFSTTTDPDSTVFVV